MLFFGDGPNRDRVLLGYQGICIALGMGKLEPKKPSIAID